MGYSHQLVTQVRGGVPFITPTATARLLSRLCGIAVPVPLQESSKRFGTADQPAANEHLRSVCAFAIAPIALPRIDDALCRRTDRRW
jgi:hypothetical protein